MLSGSGVRASGSGAHHRRLPRWQNGTEHVSVFREQNWYSFLLVFCCSVPLQYGLRGFLRPTLFGKPRKIIMNDHGDQLLRHIRAITDTPNDMAAFLDEFTTAVASHLNNRKVGYGTA